MFVFLVDNDQLLFFKIFQCVSLLFAYSHCWRSRRFKYVVAISRTTACCSTNVHMAINVKLETFKQTPLSKAATSFCVTIHTKNLRFCIHKLVIRSISAIGLNVIVWIHTTHTHSSPRAESYVTQLNNASYLLLILSLASRGFDLKTEVNFIVITFWMPSWRWPRQTN